ncbi:hypothetical protein BC833DRAFT_622722 [Globomyces pollinis-pini]|nr:hypothetical protein BC833DRAFT_622722 [Globomyces pollinis-pini]
MRKVFTEIFQRALEDTGIIGSTDQSSNEENQDTKYPIVSNLNQSKFVSNITESLSKSPITTRKNSTHQTTSVPIRKNSLLSHHFDKDSYATLNESHAESSSQNTDVTNNQNKWNFDILPPFSKLSKPDYYLSKSSSFMFTPFKSLDMQEKRTSTTSTNHEKDGPLMDLDDPEDFVSSKLGIKLVAEPLEESNLETCSNEDWVSAGSIGSQEPFDETELSDGQSGQLETEAQVELESEGDQEEEIMDKTEDEEILDNTEILNNTEEEQILDITDEEQILDNTDEEQIIDNTEEKLDNQTSSDTALSADETANVNVIELVDDSIDQDCSGKDDDENEINIQKGSDTENIFDTNNDKEIEDEQNASENSYEGQSEELDGSANGSQYEENIIEKDLEIKRLIEENNELKDSKSNEKISFQNTILDLQRQLNYTLNELNTKTQEFHSTEAQQEQNMNEIIQEYTEKIDEIEKRLNDSEMLKNEFKTKMKLLADDLKKQNLLTKELNQQLEAERTKSNETIVRFHESESAKSKIIQEKNSVHEKCISLEKELSKLKAHVKSNDQTIEKLQRQESKTSDENEELKSQIKSLNIDIEDANDTIEAQKDIILKEKQSNKTLVKQTKEFSKLLKESNKELEKTTSELQELKCKYQGELESNKQLVVSIKGYETKLKSSEKTIDEKQAKFTMLQETIVKLKAQKDNYELKLEKEDKKQQSLIGKIKQLREHIEERNEINQQKSDEIDTMTTQLREKDNSLERNQKEIETIRKDLEKMELKLREEEKSHLTTKENSIDLQKTLSGCLDDIAKLASSNQALQIQLVDQENSMMSREKCFSDTIQQAESKLIVSEHMNVELKAKLEILKEEIKLLETVQKEMESNGMQAKKAFEDLEQENIKLKGDLDESMNQNNILTCSNDSLQTVNERNGNIFKEKEVMFFNSIEQEKSKNKSLEIYNQELENKIKKLELENKTLKEDMKPMYQSSLDFQNKIQQEKNHYENKLVDHHHTKKRLSDALVKVSILEIDNQNNKTLHKKLENQLIQLETDKAGLIAKLNEQHANATKLKRLQEMDENYERLSNININLTNDLELKQKECDGVFEQNKILKEQLKFLETCKKELTKERLKNRELSETLSKFKVSYKVLSEEILLRNQKLQELQKCIDRQKKDLVRQSTVVHRQKEIIMDLVNESGDDLEVGQLLKDKSMCAEPSSISITNTSKSIETAPNRDGSGHSNVLSCNSLQMGRKPITFSDSEIQLNSLNVSQEAVNVSESITDNKIKLLEEEVCHLRKHLLAISSDKFTELEKQNEQQKAIINRMDEVIIDLKKTLEKLEKSMSEYPIFLLSMINKFQVTRNTGTVNKIGSKNYIQEHIEYLQNVLAELIDKPMMVGQLKDKQMDSSQTLVRHSSTLKELDELTDDSNQLLLQENESLKRKLDRFQTMARKMKHIMSEPNDKLEKKLNSNNQIKKNWSILRKSVDKSPSARGEEANHFKKLVGALLNSAGKLNNRTSVKSKLSDYNGSSFPMFLDVYENLLGIARGVQVETRLNNIYQAIYRLIGKLQQLEEWKEKSEVIIAERDEFVMGQLATIQKIENRMRLTGNPL